MTNSKLVCLSAVVAVLAGAMAAAAQTAPPSPSPSSPPAATKPDAAPMPQTPPAQKPAPRPGDKSATSPAKVNPLVGLAVFSADGSKLGNVQAVRSGLDGKATAIHIKTGGFLGMGGKLVAIPEGKFTKTGDRVQLSMTSEEVSKLPEVKDNS